MTLTQTIRHQAARFVNDDLTLDEFEEWLADASWNVGQLGDDAATKLTFQIERLLSEMSSGYASEDDLRNLLIALLQTDWAEFSLVGEKPLSGLRLSSEAHTQREAVPA